MFSCLRRSAALLFVLFASHLALAGAGAVCASTGMTGMSEVADMPDMPGTRPGPPPMEMVAAAAGDAEGAGEKEHVPCTTPADGSCVATMSCVTAIGAPAGHHLVQTRWAGRADPSRATLSPPRRLAVAPELPPPRSA